ncbi:two-component system regulatory protein YycI [Enterococcus saccharolyticus]|uniref:Regulatory protein YycH-like domain-containing protein n=1 Tax=Candidatus Enterococcus willemsii TaxID=1857215 RepID=A0ABQ6YX75_9ENTE|nr:MULTISPECIES: two-component system regulatory protein YycI [Enterococcus]KAF1302425.1 hypothetical protein BAU17_09220 [Enterococcus sp. CU12B]MCD5002607.1 two-component system regulatory protein YycI [Enterococcus saccharolyticus]
MDFKRIEWIFFLAFLGVNIFLFSIYREARSEQDVVYRSNQKIPIEQRLASDNIKTEGNFSKEHVEGYYLSGEPTNMQTALEQERKRLNNPNLLNQQTMVDETTLTHSVDDQVYISDDHKVEAVLQTFFMQENKLLFGKEYMYVPEWSKLDDDYPEIRAAQSYEGIPIDDSSSRLVLSLERQAELLEVVQYTQTHISNLMPLREASNLYSEEDAINTLYINNKIPSNSTIKWQRLAYTLNLRVRGKNVYVPAWFVAIEGPDETVQIERVNALTNRIVTNTPVQTVENT